MEGSPNTSTSFDSIFGNKRYGTYPGVRFSKSIDLVSISPLLLRYSRMIPGGWNLSKNLLSFIFIDTRNLNYKVIWI